MFTIQPRYLDRKHTRRMHGYFNVYAGGEYLGYVHRTGSEWMWVATHSTMFERFDRNAVIAAVRDHAA